MVFYLVTKYDPIGLIINTRILEEHQKKLRLTEFKSGVVEVFETGEIKTNCFIFKYKGRRKVFNKLNNHGFKEVRRQNNIRTLIPE